MINCPECGNQISDKATACPNCGCLIAPANGATSLMNAEKDIKDIVTIHGYEETFAVDTDVKIYKDGELVGSVSPARTFQLKIDKDCELKFKASFRTRTVQIKKGIDTNVFLSFDRVSGSLKAYVSGDDNKQEIRSLKEHKSSQATLITIIIIALLFLFGYLLQH